MLREVRRLAAQPRHATLDGLEVRYVPFLAPPRPGHYGSWGAWAAPTLAVALRSLRRRFAFDLVHAHNAVPAADAVLRAGIGRPLVVSEHGADVFHTARRHPAGLAATRRAFAQARLVLANSAGIERACRALGATRTRVVHLGTDPAGAGEGGPRRTARRRSSPSRTSSPASATRTSCARSRCCATATRRCVGS